jgi:nicotinate-nucleotide adenylyltransferase
VPRRVGLLGGSFNPAHPGHRHISLEALKRLGLDEIWWLVAPQNPLKAQRGMASLARRLEAAKALARHPRIKVLDLESRLGTRYTVDTLAALHRLFPRVHFVWLMGADNLAQIRHWQRWTEIFERTPIAVFARPAYGHKALGGLAAQRYARRRLGTAAPRRLTRIDPPAWVFLPVRLDPRSASEIRAGRTARKGDEKTKAKTR